MDAEGRELDWRVRSGSLWVSKVAVMAVGLEGDLSWMLVVTCLMWCRDNPELADGPR